MLKKDKVFISGYAKLPGGITASELYSVIAVTMVVCRESGKITEVDCTLATDTARNFVNQLLVGKNIMDLEELSEDISDNYYGAAKKALLSALKQCHEKIKLISNNMLDEIS
ncbi:DUF3870 domain-containing protein [Petroclostridium sp. X23]|uniref:DUF3870 domain-containing protein n=1 Tax=Petroclostridium sp. X23 TaxID=3045146 RepID=UPI0024ADF79D|nr:DUF3870 domain-containing protein [Petroclostridium sp. X23]WHH60620.1 DUF3870 domain-containing protein [Petroclostridium sp. X23]